MVAPIRMMVRSSTAPSSESCWVLEKRCTSSMNSTVCSPVWRRVCRAPAITSRTWATHGGQERRQLANRRPATPATSIASAVLPVPGGPYSSIEDTPPPSTSRRNGAPGPSRARCPTTSSRVRGRIRTASGARMSTTSDGALIGASRESSPPRRGSAVGSANSPCSTPDTLPSPGDVAGRTCAPAEHFQPVAIRTRSCGDESGASARPASRSRSPCGYAPPGRSQVAREPPNPLQRSPRVPRGLDPGLPAPTGSTHSAPHGGRIRGAGHRLPRRSAARRRLHPGVRPATGPAERAPSNSRSRRAPSRRGSGRATCLCRRSRRGDGRDRRDIPQGRSGSRTDH